MCEYCEKNKDLSNTLVEDLCPFNEITIMNGNLIFESSDEWHNQNTYETIKINFCPMCGRKLSNENSETNDTND